MKKKFILTLILSFALLFPSMYTNVDANNKTDIQKINEKYKVGDAISEEDIKIIEKEADPVKKDKNSDVNIQSITNWDVFGSARTPDNVHEVDISGNTTVDVGILGGSVSGNLKTSVVKGAYDSTIVEYHFSGYGLDSKGVYRKLVGIDVSETSASSSVSISFNRAYDGWLSYTSQTAYGTVKWPSGSLQANGIFYKQ